MSISNSHLENNQDLTPFLSQLESRLTTEDFFKALESQVDPTSLHVREIWLRVDDWYGEYRVVFGRHFLIRACERIGLGCEVMDAVMKQLSNNNVLEAITSHPLFWEDGKVVADDNDGIRAVAVLEEGVPFICIYECGQSYVYPRTVLKRKANLFFYKDTEVLMVSKDGTITHK